MATQQSKRSILHAVLREKSEDNAGTKNMPLENITRIAIDQNGSVGSSYDGHRDNIRGIVGGEIKTHRHPLCDQTRHKLIKGRTPESQNLLRLVEIEPELRLSISLEMTSPTGIASLINYAYVMDEQTRLFYVYQESVVESYAKDYSKLSELVRRSACESFATHIVTEVIWGIHLLVILQLPTDQKTCIDTLLKELCDSLTSNIPRVKIKSEEKALLDKILKTTAYSNIDSLTKMNNIADIYKKILKLKKTDPKQERLKYVLTPMRWFYGEHSNKLPKITFCQPNQTKTLEHYLVQQQSELKRLKYIINHDLDELLQNHCEKSKEALLEQLSKLQILRTQDIQKNDDLLTNIRKGIIEPSSLEEKVSLDPPKEIQTLVNQINKTIDILKSKGNRIKQIKENEFEYIDVAKLEGDHILEISELKSMIVGDDPCAAIFVAYDGFGEKEISEWAIHYSKIIEERKKNPNERILYIDYTYSKYKLKKMIVYLPDKKTVTDASSDTKPQNTIKKPETSPVSGTNLFEEVTKQTLSHSKSKQETIVSNESSSDEFINILLIGESGVGKSTFINAFANYLRFESLDEAEQGKPTAIIPVSFMMTINDNFDEKIIRFGNIDPNENHNNQGQSVTQKCKSYVFNITSDRKLRIIDSPGFGDTRGSDQDNFNMEEIFSFLHNLTYLNGICLLFKPEVVKLNPYLRSCFKQLFDFFGENVRNSLIFCFTNTRSTFFAPGNTRPLLKKFFEEFPVKEIPFEKRNTFCFDSESFRYLVAVQDSFKFDSTERDEIEQSWTRSVTESKRFRDLLCRQHPFRQNNEWQSTKDAQFQINCIIRPILETMRNILRNILLHTVNSSIELSAKPANPQSTICYQCNICPERYDQFLILPDHLHNVLNMCTSNEQNPTEYRIEYNAVDQRLEDSLEKLNGYITDLCVKSARFAQFLIENADTAAADPFLSGIDRMINEESFILQKETPSNFNKN